MKRQKRYLFLLCLLVSIVLIAAVIHIKQPAQTFLKDDSSASSLEKAVVHFIDVGQGDSILITCSDMTMLIDAGPRSAKEELLSYLDDLGIARLNYVVATHPHEDHIGNMDSIIENYDIGKIIMPKKQANTQTFERLLNAVKAKSLNIISPVVGDSYPLGDGEFEILAPNNVEYSDVNDYSVVLRFVFGETSFLFTGDAETVSEEEMMQNKSTLSADVLKVGHHGSNGATSDAFLEAVSPKIAVIFCKTGNSYHHPHAETLEKLSRFGCQILRTDLQGTIILESNGTEISVIKPVSEEDAA